MLDVDQQPQSDRPSSLAEWAHRTLGQPGVRLRVRVQGNNLHILCESRQSLDAKGIINRLVKALQRQSGEALAIPSRTPIDQIIVYGRLWGQQQPEWIKPIRVKLAQSPTPKASVPSKAAAGANSTTDPTFIVSNESLARSGSPEAIARYLSETLSPLGVSVKILIQELRGGEGESFPHAPTPVSPRRLWVLCHSNYSPDASLLAESIVQQLRNLQLQGFRDAAICSQVSGEATPEWMLRVDLTPKDEMLKAWACWGDVQALARLLNQTLVKASMEVRAVLKDATLHLFCSALEGKKNTAPDKPRAVNTIIPILKAIAPQGIHSVTIYGVEPPSLTPVPQQETPIWIEWQHLPSADNPRLAESALSLGQQGNLEALTFLLERLLNPDLNRRLATGGIHLKIRRKQDLLHIMSEAPICPPQGQVGPPITRFLRQLAIPDVAGVRVYGRRAGATSPAWNYGVDFVPRKRFVPEATPEFAATDAYVSELVALTGEPVLRPELTKQDLESGLQRTGGSMVRTLQRWLGYSQLFVPTDNHPEPTIASQRQINNQFASSQGIKVALVWGALGLLLTLQLDWLLGQFLDTSSTSPRLTTREAELKPVDLPNLSLQKGGRSSPANFNESGFTRQGETNLVISEANNSLSTGTNSAVGAAILAEARSPNPSFNNPLLDQKLALYQQRLLQSGPPDVLIIGSSRALRGIDPVALQDALAQEGYPDVEVFNFGINGATAQVVDLLIRRVLTPEQLPKLIIWADGARAFNSGRVDTTYNAITTSQGYEELNAGTFPNQASNAGSTPSATQSTQPLAAWQAGYQSVNNWLSESLGKLSSTYRRRDQLKTQLQEQFVTLTQPLETPQTESTTDPEADLAPQESIDVDGFLPLSIRFNPATYYKQHPRVAGDYDRDYESFQLGGKQDSALETLLNFAQANNVGIVFVNLPLTKDYLDPVRSEYEEKFQRHMRTSAVSRGLIFRDLSQLLLTKPDYFSDPSHLNRYGAYNVSYHLAQDPMIPWPSKGNGN